MAHRSLRQIYSRRVPPNWSPRDWFEEMRAETDAAAWEARLDFDPTRGVPLDAYVHQRVMSQVWARYRREWAYAHRCGRHLEGNDWDDTRADGLSSIQVFDALRSFLDRLAEPERRLIGELYWEGKKEVEVAQLLCLTQSAISRRKGRIIKQLRRWMHQPGRRD